MVNHLKFIANSLFSVILFASISMFFITSPSIALGVRASYLVESDLRNVDRDLETNKFEHKRNSKQLLEAEKDLETLPDQIETEEKKLKTRASGVEEARKALDRTREDFLENPSISVSRFEENHQKAKNDLQDSKDELERMKARLAAATREVPETKNEISRLETEGENLVERKSELENELEDAKEEEEEEREKRKQEKEEAEERRMQEEEEAEAKRKAAEPWVPSGYSIILSSTQGDLNPDDFDSVCTDCTHEHKGVELIFPSGFALSYSTQDITVNSVPDGSFSSSDTISYVGTANILGFGVYIGGGKRPIFGFGLELSISEEGEGTSTDGFFGTKEEIINHSYFGFSFSFSFILGNRGILSIRGIISSVDVASETFSIFSLGFGLGLIF